MLKLTFLGQLILLVRRLRFLDCLLGFGQTIILLLNGLNIVASALQLDFLPWPLRFHCRMTLVEFIGMHLTRRRNFLRTRQIVCSFRRTADRLLIIRLLTEVYLVLRAPLGRQVNTLAFGHVLGPEHLV